MRSWLAITIVRIKILTTVLIFTASWLPCECKWKAMRQKLWNYFDSNSKYSSQGLCYVKALTILTTNYLTSNPITSECVCPPNLMAKWLVCEIAKEFSSASPRAEGSKKADEIILIHDMTLTLQIFISSRLFKMTHSFAFKSSILFKFTNLREACFTINHGLLYILWLI